MGDEVIKDAKRKDITESIIALDAKSDEFDAKISQLNIESDRLTNLPLVETFNPPYKIWKTREPTMSESRQHLQETGCVSAPNVNVCLKEKIHNALEAANYIVRDNSDIDGLANHINSTLDKCLLYKNRRNYMPRKTPVPIRDYQNKYPLDDYTSVDYSIKEHGCILSDGQFLFHAGLWPYETIKPLSTTFCPQVALNNVLHKAKAFNNGRIDIFVLRVVNPKTKVFVFQRTGTRLGHENEVLFASGATLIIRAKKKIRDDFLVFNASGGQKKIPVYVLEIDIS